ncbi:hypothetical protein [Defluviitalea phaphyphila]|uniref:hypothetical protein n=1 Tax=Defluviitalea phaphyphila TaxID=1473580 RepID=UPI000730B4A9|nr:hypothetical protein [Defluviitalea phaphyphila]
MEYFVIETDDRRSKPLKISLLESELKSEEPITKKINVSQEGMVCEVEYVDFISSPIPLFSDKFKDIASTYYPDLNWRPIFVVTKDKNLVYWLLEEEIVEEVVEEDEDKQIKIKKEELEDRTLFIAKLGKFKKITIVPLALAESILRNNLSGIRMKKLKQY